jgi:predicted aldo/keto reductase-like oxidoreductase
MEKRTLVNETVSLLGFGCMRLPLKGKKIDMDETAKMFDLSVKSGVNYFDTAYPYHDGKSESVTGEILKNYSREQFYIADKFPPWMLNSPSDMDQIFNTQLKRLGIDYMKYIDFYLLHSLERGCMDKIINMKVYEHFLKKKEAGIIKYLGFSFHDTPDVLEEIVERYDFDFAQIQMNYLDWSYMNAEKSYNILASRNIPVIVMEPVRGGFLADPAPAVTGMIKEKGITPAALALKWAAGFDAVKVVLSGMSSLEQVKENTALFTGYKKITDDEKKLAETAAQMISDIKTFPCTGCRYCMDCPAGVDIPELFRIYNHYMAVKDNFRVGLTYKNYFDPAKKPENCTRCGECSKRCPQHIDIPAALDKAKVTLNALFP